MLNLELEFRLEVLNLGYFWPVHNILENLVSLIEGVDSGERIKKLRVNIFLDITVEFGDFAEL